VILLSGGAQGARDSRQTTTGSARRSARPKTARSKAVRSKTAQPEPRASRRPYLVVAGLTVSFSLFTLLGALLLSALPLPKDTIGWAGRVVLVLLGISLMVPRVEELLEKPFSRIPQRAVNADRGALTLGFALGAVYVPCAGPVLAAISVAGATGHIGGQTIA